MYFVIWKQKNKYRLFSNQIFSEEKDAIKKAEKLPIEKWKNFEQENGGDFAIDDIWEDDNE